MKNELLYDITETKTDKSNYTLSLLQMCSLNRILENKKILQIKNVLDKEFTETANQYVKRCSSSVSRNIAENIYLSVLFQCDSFLLSLNSDEKAIQALCSLPMEHIISEGRLLILKATDETRKIFKNAYNYRLNIPVYEYQFVMEKAIDEFYSKYSARFNACDVCTSIDYPLLNFSPYAMQEKGIFFMKKYYTSLLYENKFCSLFSENEIINLLESYGKIYHCSYTDLLFNICEIVFNNYLVYNFLYVNQHKLLISSYDIEKTYEKFRGLKPEGIGQNAEIFYCMIILLKMITLYHNI